MDTQLRLVSEPIETVLIPALYFAYVRAVQALKPIEFQRFYEDPRVQGGMSIDETLNDRYDEHLRSIVPWDCAEGMIKSDARGRKLATDAVFGVRKYDAIARYLCDMQAQEMEVDPDQLLRDLKSKGHVHSMVGKSVQKELKRHGIGVYIDHVCEWYGITVLDPTAFPHVLETLKKPPKINDPVFLLPLVYVQLNDPMQAPEITIRYSHHDDSVVGPWNGGAPEGIDKNLLKVLSRSNLEHVARDLSRNLGHQGVKKFFESEEIVVTLSTEMKRMLEQGEAYRFQTSPLDSEALPELFEFYELLSSLLPQLPSARSQIEALDRIQ